MSEQAKHKTHGGHAPEEVAHSGLVPQVAMMLRALWDAQARNVLLLMSAALFVVIAVTAYGQIRLNRWNQPFYDALSHRDFDQFLMQLGVFVAIAACLLILNVAQRWLNEMLKVKLREGLTLDLIDHWLAPRRAFRLAHAGEVGVNPDQRMHEDARHLTELTADLGVGLLQASILLVSFIKVLWGLSSGFAFHVGQRLVAIPGYMVWAGIIYAGSASLLSLWVGRSLVARNAGRYAREADLRFTLVRVNEHIDSISLAAGEEDEARRIKKDLRAVLAAMRRLVTGLTNLTWITAGYGWFTLVAPILVAAPPYFAGSLSFGGLMMAAGAFNQVQSSLRWFVDNFSSLADWRATLLRVANFRSAVLGSDQIHRVESRIASAEGEPGKIQIESLEIASPAGCTLLKEPKVEVTSGERLHIVGDTGTGKTLLFRALAGLWPWGAGRITRPKGEKIWYMPRTPYLPPGSLAEAVAYPSKMEDFPAHSFADALSRLGLPRLVPMLKESRAWDQELSDAEQQGVAFARVMLHAPPWLIIDEVFDSIDEDMREHVTEVFASELKGSGIIHIGRSKMRDPHFKRVVHLIQDPTTRRLPTRQAATAANQKARGARKTANQ
jgi:vitamin B12/bleomycin/antimicrobial peptide transport system ATP-binding/permease protein